MLVHARIAGSRFYEWDGSEWVFLDIAPLGLGNEDGQSMALQSDGTVRTVRPAYVVLSFDPTAAP